VSLLVLSFVSFVALDCLLIFMNCSASYSLYDSPKADFSKCIFFVSFYAYIPLETMDPKAKETS